MVLDKKKGLVCVVLVVILLVISILVMSSINLFSMSKKSPYINVAPKNLIEMIDKSSLTKFLSAPEKLKILDYLMEYEALKSRLKVLGFSELNRFMFLGNYLSDYFSTDELEITKDLLDNTLTRFGEVSKQENGENFTVNREDKLVILGKTNAIREGVKSLYDDSKISTKAYQEILGKLDDVEYNINLSSIDLKDIDVDFSDISKILDREKSGYLKGVDLSAFTDIDSDLLDIQKTIDSISYISDFLGNSIVNVGKEDGSISKNFQVSNVLNNIDTEAFSGLSDLVKEDVSVNEAGYVDFSESISMPKITVEGSLKDAWDLNIKTSSLDLSNLLAPVDEALIPNDLFKNKLNDITNVKVPAIEFPKEYYDNNPKETNDTQESNVIDELQKTSSPKEDNKTQQSDDSILKNISLKVIAVVVVLVVLCGVWVVIKKFNKDHPKYYKDLKKKEFSIYDNLPKNYKQRLIEEGSYVLDVISKNYLKYDKTMTPRETIYEFEKAAALFDDGRCYRFLKYFEESTFYNLEVNEGMYLEFDGICRSILKLIQGKRMIL